MAWLRKNTQSDMFGKNMTLREDGRLVHDMYLFQVKKPSESKGPWDYYNVRADDSGGSGVPAAFAVAMPAGQEVDARVALRQTEHAMTSE